MTRATAALVLLVALVAAACGNASPSTGTATTPGASIAPPAASSDIPATSSAEPSGSSASSGTPETSPVDTAPPGPTESGAPSDSSSLAPSPSAGGGTAAACTGSAANQGFYANLAASVSWAVYCAVLPKGWVVSSGSYRLANGGKLVIGYKGPGGATLSLSEGSFCTDGSGCVPSGGDTGTASFGSMPGTLVTTDAGGFAIVVARGQEPSWLMVTGGLDQATTVALSAALAKVGS